MTISTNRPHKIKLSSAQRWVDSLTYEQLHAENELVREKVSKRTRAERDWVQIKVALMEAVEQANKTITDQNTPETGESTDNGRTVA